MLNKIEDMMRFPLTHYLIALIAVVFVCLIRFLLDPVLGEHHPFVIFLAAVFVAAWIGGWKPGALALVLGYLAADMFFIEPRGSLGINSVEDLVGLVFYLFVGGLALTQIETMRRHAGELNQTNDLLRREATARQDVEAALQESERHARLLLDSTAEAIYGVDLQRNCTFANPACLRLFGFTELRQILGKAFSN